MNLNFLSICLLKTTFAKVNTVIVILFYSGNWKPALLLDATGRQDQVDCFSPDQFKEAYWSCSLTWQNQLYIFGGQSRKQQIKILSDRSLQVVGYLKFDRKFGACTNLANKKVYLCFNNVQSDYKRCRWSREPLGSFEEATLATYDHKQSRISSSDGKL